ncbi:Exportin-7, partial [Dissostichus eleginoides]
GLAQLEILCKQLYETTDSAVRLQAEKALVEFTNSPDCLSKCQLLLERGSSSYSQLLAAVLSKLVSRTSNPLPLEQRIDIREFPASTLTPLSICSSCLLSSSRFKSHVHGNTTDVFLQHLFTDVQKHVEKRLFPENSFR